MKLRYALLGALVLGAAGYLFWAALLGHRPGAAPQEELQIGTNVWPGYEPLYLARDLGLLDPEKIRLGEFTSATQVIRALRNGLLDGGTVTLDEALLLLESGVEVDVVLVMDISDGGDAILARPPAKTLADLAGRPVAVESNALGAFMLVRALEIYGMSPGEVEVKPYTVNGHLEAYTSGAVDGVVTFEPVRSHLLRVGAKVVFDSRQIPGEIVDVLVVRRSLSRADDPRITHLIQAWYGALKLLEEQPQEAAMHMGRRLKLKPEAVLASYEGLHLPGAKEVLHLLEGEPSPLEQTMGRLSRVLVEQELMASEPELAQAAYSEYIRNYLKP